MMIYSFESKHGPVDSFRMIYRSGQFWMTLWLLLIAVALFACSTLPNIAARYWILDITFPRSHLLTFKMKTKCIVLVFLIVMTAPVAISLAEEKGGGAAEMARKLQIGL
jgi:hypothetical protein